MFEALTVVALIVVALIVFVDTIPTANIELLFVSAWVPVGIVVPIPTLPSLVMRTFSTPLV